MTSSPITSWQTEGENVDALIYFLFLSSKITVDGDCCNHEIRRLLLGRKAITNLDSVLKSKDITFADKGSYSQGYHISCSHVQIWELDPKEGRVLKNWCFQTVVLEKNFESPLDSKEPKPLVSLSLFLIIVIYFLIEDNCFIEFYWFLPNINMTSQSVLKEIYPEYSLEGLMLKLKLQYFGHLIQRVDLLEKTLILGKIEGRRRGWQRMR